MAGYGVVKVDVHGMNEWQARLAIDAALRRANGGVYRICVIHGFNRGSVLRDMIHFQYAHNERVLRLEPGDNPGQTDLVLKEL